MPQDDFLHRFAENVTPSDAFSRTVKSRILRRIGAQDMKQTVGGVSPAPAFHRMVKERILQSIQPDLARDLLSLASRTHAPVFPRAGMRAFARLAPLKDSPRMQGWMKWSAAFALFLIIIRSMPLILLAPPTMADAGVQLLPVGEEVTMFIGGVWQNVTEPQRLTGPTMISTGASRATIILNDDGVIRLGPNTTLKLHDTADHPHASSIGPTATLVRGQAWALGLLPPVVEGLALETDQGILSLNAGSASVHQDGKTVSVAAYDKGVTFHRLDQTVFLVSGEKVSFTARPTYSIVSMPVTVYAGPWVSENLSQDAVHRNEIAKLQEVRRATIAGILPTSIFYPAKRIAEQVDVLFTLTHDGRTEKRIQQANTRLSEAIALFKSGQHEEASAPLLEYSQSLVSLASDQEDNIVKELIKKQIANASTSLTSPSGPEENIALLTAAVERVGAAIPDAELSPKDIQGYVLVDKLAQINKILSLDRDVVAATKAYGEISPYLQALLAEGTGSHPLLQKEARSLLVSTSSLLSKADVVSDGGVTIAMQTDIEQYLPAEQAQVLVTEEELNTMVTAMMDRIFVFRHPRSRYNQLLVEMQGIAKNPNRGTLLRRLKSALPEGLGDYVNTEIRNLGNELQS